MGLRPTDPGPRCLGPRGSGRRGDQGLRAQGFSFRAQGLRAQGLGALGNQKLGGKVNSRQPCLTSQNRPKTLHRQTEFAPSENPQEYAQLPQRPHCPRNAAESAHNCPRRRFVAQFLSQHLREPFGSSGFLPGSSWVIWVILGPLGSSRLVHF